VVDRLPAVKLHPDNLSRLAVGVRCFQYDRTKLKSGIVHLGIGAFMRAHLGPIHDAFIESQTSPAALSERDEGHWTKWGIVGVSLRQTDTRDALTPQEGLYTLGIRDADQDGKPRQVLQVIGCVRQILVAPDSPQAVLDQIAHPDIKIVSLTITEKGYCHTPADGTLHFAHPDIQHDLARPESPRTAIGFIVYGLAARKRQSGSPLTLMSLDNLPSNGHLLKSLVLAFARKYDSDLAHWIEQRCTFPCSMVDRIVPRTPQADINKIAGALNALDNWPVIAEPFIDWVIEDEFAAGRPDWAAGGARFVKNATPWETLKLRMVNGAHSGIAYLGSVAGWSTVDIAIKQPELRACIEALLRDEVEPTLSSLSGINLASYRDSLLARFANPALAHRTQQIAMDGSQKIPQRWLGTLTDQSNMKGETKLLSLCLAGWLRYLQGYDEAGNRYEISDPLADDLKKKLVVAPALDGDRQSCQARARALCQVETVFGQYGAVLTDDLIELVGHHLYLLNTIGVSKTIRHVLT
jgi:fructuronate reductase